MVNNFEHIRSLLEFESSDDFYFIQIIKRRKDNPGLSRDMKLIDNYFIYSLEEYDKVELKIVEQCMLNNSRAYIRLNRRSAKICSVQTIRKITELMLNNDHKSVKNAYLSVAGEFHNEKPKRWVVDIDEEDLLNKEDIEKTIEDLHKDSPGYSYIATIKTKNGYHLIVNPFNLKIFKGKFPTVEIKKDNPTLLFCP
jgi:hypothetical protein